MNNRLTKSPDLQVLVALEAKFTTDTERNSNIP